MISKWHAPENQWVVPRSLWEFSSVVSLWIFWRIWIGMYETRHGQPFFVKLATWGDMVYHQAGCPWCTDYRRRKWTRRLEFKCWTRLIAFHIALIPLEKVWIQLFSLQLWVNSRTDWVLQPWWGNWSRRRKTLNSNLLDSA